MMQDKYKMTAVAATLMMAVMTAQAGVTESIHTDKTAITDTSRVVDIDEVVVTAQPKEAFRLRRQPLSSSSFSGNDIDGYSAHDMRELSAYVPSFAMPEYGSRLTSSMYVRGIGSRINSPAVSFYLDDIPLVSKGAMNFHTYQTDRIDVLRGPQGTLYGQNSEGGLVRIYTKDPSRYQGTDVRLGIGSHLWRNAEAAHYRKVSDAFAFSVAGFYDGTDGSLRNVTTGDRADAMNEGGANVKLVFTPTPRLTLRLVADYQYVDQNGFAYGRLHLDDGQTESPSSNHTGTYRRHMANTGLSLWYAGKGYSLHSMTTYQYLNDRMLMDQDYLPTDYMHLVQRQLQNAVTEEVTVKSENRSAWHWTFGAFASHQWLRTDGPVYFGEGITGPMADGIQTSMYNAILASMTQQFVDKGLPQQAAAATARQVIERAGGITMSAEMSVPGVFRTPQMNFGLFHESNIDITDRLTATLGLRYDLSRTQIEYNTTAAMAMTANVMGQKATYTLTSHLLDKTHDAFNQLLPKIGLSYRLDHQGSNAYVLVSKGYRAGGYNIQMFADILQTELMANRQQAMRGDYDVPHTADDYRRVEGTIAYKPETTWNYEAGAHLNLFGHMLHLDVAAYLMQVRNQQLSVMAGTYGYGRMMVNAGRSRSCGLEMALRGQAADDHLLWAVSYGYTHSVFREYTDEVTTGGQSVTRDYRGKRVPYVPAHTLGASITYRQDLSSPLLRTLTYGLSLSGQGQTYWDEANTYAQHFYALLGAHIDADFGAVSVSLWGKNLTGTRYNTFAISSAATGTTEYFAQRGNPFQMGVEVKLHF